MHAQILLIQACTCMYKYIIVWLSHLKAIVVACTCMHLVVSFDEDLQQLGSNELLSGQKSET